MENKQVKKMNNKGFSLVELIIVMAIMAILVGVVGTQVIPYMNKSKESKDYQVVSSYATAAMTAYTANVTKENAPTSATTYKIYGTTVATGSAVTFADAFITEVRGLTYADPTTLKAAMGSEEGQKITDIEVTIDPSGRKLTVKAVGPTAGTFDDIENPM